jgi:hypothetical protein
VLAERIFNLCLDAVVQKLLSLYQKREGCTLLVGAEKYGRIGNRLYLGAHLVAWAKKTQSLLLYPGFHDCEHFFQATCKDALCRYPEPDVPLCLSSGFKKMIQQSIDRLSLRVLAKPSTRFQTIDLQPSGPDISKPQFKRSLTSHPITFIRGFIYDNSQPDIAEEISTIQHHFRPRNDYYDGIHHPIITLRQKTDIVLGVVIRHGDFKTWRNGEFYFNTEDYVELMNRALKFLMPKKVGFFIASDDEQPSGAFAQFTHFFRAGHPIENLGALSLCDGLLAANSSFTGWSQYYGSVPTLHISRLVNDSDLEQLLCDATSKAQTR